MIKSTVVDNERHTLQTFLFEKEFSYQEKSVLIQDNVRREAKEWFESEQGEKAYHPIKGKHKPRYINFLYRNYLERQGIELKKSEKTVYLLDCRHEHFTKDCDYPNMGEKYHIGNGLSDKLPLMVMFKRMKETGKLILSLMEYHAQSAYYCKNVLQKFKKNTDLVISGNKLMLFHDNLLISNPEKLQRHLEKVKNLIAYLEKSDLDLTDTPFLEIKKAFGDGSLAHYRYSQNPIYNELPLKGLARGAIFGAVDYEYPYPVYVNNKLYPITSINNKGDKAVMQQLRKLRANIIRYLKQGDTMGATNHFLNKIDYPPSIRKILLQKPYIMPAPSLLLKQLIDDLGVDIARNVLTNTDYIERAIGILLLVKAGFHYKTLLAQSDNYDNHLFRNGIKSILTLHIGTGFELPKRNHDSLDDYMEKMSGILCICSRLCRANLSKNEIDNFLAQSPKAISGLRFLSTCYQAGDIKIRPIANMQEFINVGSVLENCLTVGSSYYEAWINAYCFLFVVTKNDEYVALVEVDTNNTIICAKGKHNAPINSKDPIFKNTIKDWAELNNIPIKSRDLD